MNWQELANTQRDHYLRDLISLIKIPSVRDEEKASPEYPLGPALAQALKAFLEMADQDGFRVKNIDNVVGYAEWGDGEETLAILAHLDVMPAGNGWDTDPFDPVIKDGNIYGRGASDDKGPGLAAYYALKELKDQGIEFNKRVRFIVGTDEESNWTGMKRYFEVEPAPTLGFSPDAEFPVINGEKGQVSLKLSGSGDNDGQVQLIKFDAGLRFNMVPREATAVLSGTNVDQLQEAFDQSIQAEPVSGSMTADGDQVKFEILGKAAHGAEPEKGINAGTYLAKFLKQVPLNGQAANFVTFLADYLHLDTRVRNFKADFRDEVMGEMTMNAGILQFDQTKGIQIDMNFRYPKGITPTEINQQISQVANQLGLTVTTGRNQDPHYVDPTDPIVQTLMKAYRDQTGDQSAQPLVVGGGTYGRLMKRGVAFGALMPTTPNVMHQANEFQPVEDLLLSMAIYMQAIYDLVTD